ncbi:hypothetical protein K466DRAFT_407588 [Polyporus arcularius HHB13444]|uniref:Uncharacterized protein n=1 Tax=Polyporus arcularius HHB13444 TaxID=1314778 RepID=A0A5C3NV34_9APHY|nr:hypothetical protein K466DRAFT_407588 [Polyporus arcularius HHB13444]
MRVCAQGEYASAHHFPSLVVPTALRAPSACFPTRQISSIRGRAYHSIYSPEATKLRVPGLFLLRRPLVRPLPQPSRDCSLVCAIARSLPLPRTRIEVTSRDATRTQTGWRACNPVLDVSAKQVSQRRSSSPFVERSQVRVPWIRTATSAASVPRQVPELRTSGRGAELQDGAGEQDRARERHDGIQLRRYHLTDR